LTIHSCTIYYRLGEDHLLQNGGRANPVEKYLVDLDSKERAAVADALKGDRDFRPARSRVRTRQIKGKLWEIKASQQLGVLRRV